MSKDPPLAKLIQRYINGDSRACEQLLSYREYRQRVIRIAHKQTRGHTISWEDAAQTAHEKVFQALKKRDFCPERGDFLPWAGTVAKFAIIDLMRKEKQKYCRSLDEHIPGTDILLSDTVADDFNLSDVVERTHLVFQVKKAIAALDQQYPKRGYLLMWQGKVQGKTYTQVAAELGITQSAVSKRWKELTARIADKFGLLPDGDNKPEDKGKQGQKNRQTRSNLNW
ncbi:MAG: sigma-70 family RNA polymerase sigma factor [Symploca sp. SIO2C1]|nr:sigma-70 family RNA polymerase sigma factor [Symploca sp. SIO2C1]